MHNAEQLSLDLEPASTQLSEPLATLVEAIDSDRDGCAHGAPSCSRCLADLALRALRDHILDELANADRYEDWRRANADQFGELDDDMPPVQLVAHYLVDVVLPSAPPAETVATGDLL